MEDSRLRFQFPSFIKITSTETKQMLALLTVYQFYMVGSSYVED